MIQAALWKADDLKPQDKYVAVALASRADVLGICRADTQKLAELTGYSTRTIRDAIRRLLRADVLKMAGPHHPDRYTFTAQFHGGR